MLDPVKFVVVDIETTGLEYETDTILELGVILATANLDYVASKHQCFYYDRTGNEPDVVAEMHEASGLWEICADPTLPSEYEVCQDFVTFLEVHGATGLPMCGSSVHFDRGFLKSDMALFESVFHYRNIDVSTIKNLAELWNEGAFKGRPEGDKQHRALPDCYDTIEELKYYRTTFLRTERDLDSAN